MSEPVAQDMETGREPLVGTNPLGRYCADPNLVVFDGRWFLYCTEDGNADWSSTSFYAYSSPDLVHWDRRKILDLEQVPWWTGQTGGWAPSVLRRGQGDYLFYFVADRQIGVAHGSSPNGPFVSIDRPIIAEGDYDCYPIDPAVFIDDDGSRYLLWGNSRAYLARLADDGMSVEESTAVSWVPGDFREAIYINKRQGRYYASWSENDTRDPRYCVRYAVSDSLFGPWSEPRTLLEKCESLGILATGHHSIANIPGTDEWVIAYHRFAMNGHGDGCHRETVFAPLGFRSDGSIRQVNPQPGSYWRPIGPA
ncbi:glycosyl hydrolase, family 43 [Bifidobacterium actinocoloniiforme DSM 22766]|uniref:Glycosyl hydrolase, family 43 n=1 Tax=Bifidobacterium actinocoloniiforme DSM 22766 TaxID=1437605 RepID=A0A086YYF0_9BIFI|nr:family 43 glycosylhydrolase [Bifidobacterium actinocoloniiforme]AKV55851.1 glycosyl hydrolase [Bifidobacterium actinocoloniiforme DSM 22766]KFI39300.1 glycosyl hydrolase, family 43 [Bifidobacterium actinocoloniiforme DSM 22766]